MTRLLLNRRLQQKNKENKRDSDAHSVKKGSNWHFGYKAHVGADKVARKYKFINPYMGKDYGGSAYEFVSMGFEYAYTKPYKFANDKDMLQWIFGILTVY